MVRHFGTSRRAAARAAAATAEVFEEPSGEPIRRYRYVVHVREHTLIVPMVSTATVAALIDEVAERASRRQLASSAVVDVQVRTEAGTGFLEPSDCLEDVVTEQDELVAVLEGSYPVRVGSMIPTAAEVLGRAGAAQTAEARGEASGGRQRADTATPLPDAWSAAIVTIDLVGAERSPRLAAPDGGPNESMRELPSGVALLSPTAGGGGGGGRKPSLSSSQKRLGLPSSEPVATEHVGPPLNLAGKQRAYLTGLLAEMHRHDAAGVPLYKQRLLDALQSRSMHDSSSERPLLQPALGRRALRAQLDDTMAAAAAGDGLHASMSASLPPIRTAASDRPLVAARSASTLGVSELDGDGMHAGLERARARSAHALGALSYAELLEERERRHFFFQNALSKLELDALELHDREEAVRAQAAAAEAAAAQVRAETSLTPAQLAAKHQRVVTSTMSRLKRAELRLSESVTNNAALKERVNHYRKELKIFVSRLAKVREADTGLSRDVRHITGLVQASMDDRHKIRSRIERLQHEHRTESKLFGKQLARLEAEADALEDARAARAREIEASEDADKRRNFLRLHKWRSTVRGRELRGGRLEDHLGWFQRQAKQMEELINVNFRPELPGGAGETIAHYSRTQAHTQSLWTRLNDHELHAAELNAEIRELNQRLERLELERAEREAELSNEQAADDRMRATLAEPTADEFVSALLEQLCPVMQRIFESLGCDADALPEAARAAGIRPSTLPYYANLVENALKAKLLRARQLKAFRKLRAREEAKGEGLSPRSTIAAEDHAGFAPELRATLDPFEATYDVLRKPYDIDEEFTRLLIDAGRRELQADYERRAKGGEEEFTAPW